MPSNRPVKGKGEQPLHHMDIVWAELLCQFQLPALDMDGFDFVRCHFVEVRKMLLDGGIAVQVSALIYLRFVPRKIGIFNECLKRNGLLFFHPVL